MLIFYHKKYKNFIRFGIPVSFLTILFIGLYIYKWEYREPLLEVRFLSLNRGRSIFIRTPQNKTILAGGGQNSEVISEITKAGPFYSRKIDVIITTSATPAQIGGLLEVIERYEVGEIIMPNFIATSTVLTKLLKEVRKKKIHIEEVERGDVVEIDGVKLNILFPYKEFKFNKTSLPELGLVIEYKNTKAYLIGNLSKTIQKDIFKNLEINKSKNIVEYYHSMTDAKVSAELLEAIDPEFIFSTKENTLHVVSDGAGWRKRE